MQLVCDDGCLASALRKRYRAFLSDDLPHLILHIAVAGSDQRLHPALADLELCGNIVQ